MLRRRALRLTLALLAVAAGGAAAAPVAGAVVPIDVVPGGSVPFGSQVTVSTTFACSTGTTYTWTITGGTDVSGADNTRTFTVSRAHSVNVSVEAQPAGADDPTCPTGDTGATIVPVQNRAPSVGAISPTSAIAGKSTTFAVQASDPDGDSLSYVWDFGDGPQTSSKFTFPDVGQYPIGVTVSDGSASVGASTTVAVTALNQRPDCTAITPSTSATTPHALDFASSCSDPDSGPYPLAYTWNFGDGSGDLPGAAAMTHQYGTHGPFSVSVTASDGAAFDSLSSPNIVAPNRAPTPAFDVSPTIVAINAPVALNAETTTDPDVDGITNYAWDLDNDGAADDAFGATASTMFPTPGVKTIGLQVTDSFGGVAATTRFVTVSTNAPPTPSFTFSPGAPQTGQTITFTSTSTAGAAPISGLTWDLDDDGQYDDASGPTAQWTFTTGGVHTVRLRASDANFPEGPGAPATFQRISVTDPAAPPVSDPTPTSPPAVIATSKPKLTILQPFPIVRIRGRLVGSGVDLTLLSVRAPKGAKVKVVCKGKGCPKRTTLYYTVKKGGGVRIRKLERPLGKNAVIEIYVTKTGTIGKYTRFRIRQGKSPARKDACAAFGAKTSMRCPSG